MNPSIGHEYPARPGQVTIGARLRILRRWRGLSQEQLAGLAGVTQGCISRIEKGTRPLDRRSLIAALAAALEVSETDLVGGPHLSRDRVQSDPHLHIPALRVALTTASLDSPAVDRGRTLAGLRAALYGPVETARRACDYVTAGKLLPSLIDELYWSAASSADQDRSAALEALSEACAQASRLAHSLRYPDLAFLAARAAQDAAQASGDPVVAGRAAFALLHARPRAGSWDRNLIAAGRAVDALEPAAKDDRGRQVLTMLMLTAAMSAAAANREDDAASWLDSAASAAAVYPDEPDVNWQSASTANVDLWRVSVAVEAGAPEREVLQLARRVDLSISAGRFSSTAARVADFRADVGAALARDRKSRRDAVTWLARAERTAPQRIRNSAAVRETVAYLLNNAPGPDLRGMASRMGIPV